MRLCSFLNYDGAKAGEIVWYYNADKDVSIDPQEISVKKYKEPLVVTVKDSFEVLGRAVSIQLMVNPTTPQGSQTLNHLRTIIPFSVNMRIITDDPIEREHEDAFNFSIYARNLASIIRDSPPKFAIGIFGGWGTGKSSLMQLIQNELKQQDKDRILTVWFDAWRYEREKYVAIIPFLRLMSIALKERLEGDRENKEIWYRVKEGLDKTVGAIIDSMDVTIGPEFHPSSTSSSSSSSSSSKSSFSCAATP